MEGDLGIIWSNSHFIEKKSGLSVVKLFVQGWLGIKYRPENISYISNQDISEVRQSNPTWSNN